MEQEKKKNSKKIIIILSIVIFLLVLSFASYVIYEKYQENLAQERQALLENTKQKYEKINSDIEKLILSEEEQKEINEQIETVKKAIDNNNISNETSSIIEDITSRIAEIKTNNNSNLEEEEKKSNEIDISKFNDEQKKKIDELLKEYNNLKNEEKYKEAQTKMKEIIDYKNNTNEEITKTEEEKKKQEQIENKQQVTSNKNSSTVSSNKNTHSNNSNSTSSNKNDNSNSDSNSSNTQNNQSNSVSSSNITHNITLKYNATNSPQYSSHWIRYFTYSGSVKNSSNVTVVVQVRINLYDYSNVAVLARTETRTIEIAPKRSNGSKCQI